MAAVGDAGETSHPLIPGIDTNGDGSVGASRTSRDSLSSVSTTSLVFERISERLARKPSAPHNGNTASYLADHLSDIIDDDDPLKDEGSSDDLETGAFLRNGVTAEPRGSKPIDPRLRRVLLVLGGLVLAAWVLGLVGYVSTQAYRHPSQGEHDPQATASRGSGKKVTLDQVLDGFWTPHSRSISWIAGPEGEDGLLLEAGAEDKAFLVVEDVRALDPAGTSGGGAGAAPVQSRRTLMKTNTFTYGGKSHSPQMTRPSADLQRVLVGTDLHSNWRHSTTGVYWIFDVESQQAEPLVPGEPEARLQLAQWSPTSDAIVYTRENNMYLRRVGSDKVIPITTDGGPEVFNGVPDWVYEEEVFGGASATWWSDDGDYIAFLRTNETGVPEFPVPYFVSRPSGETPPAGEESYPEVRMIKYPKAGAHNPVVDLWFYDTARGDVFAVDIAGGFADEDRLITTVVWAGKQLLVKETNRVSDVLRVVLVDAVARSGKTIRTTDIKSIDGGWFEISQNTRYVPADASKGRANDGYIDTVVYDDGDHLAYFTPLDTPDPIMLTSGPWEVIDAPSAVDLDRNLVYFAATKASSIQRHIYSVNLTGEGMAPVTDVSEDGYYAMSFSSGAGYGLLTYQGPGIPWQKVISTPSNAAPYARTVEENKELADKAKKHELPIMVYGTVEVDGVALNYVERRPPHFDEKKKYPVLFYLYGGPGSQVVNKRFGVDFQAFVAAGLGYVCVSVDGRGTGNMGRKNRVLVRENLGEVESHDQIAAARMWASKSYVDASRLAIWGWSYGGFMTLKTLERDAGATFRYGMAVAPVTDWHFYDSIYTERYMLTPQANPAGYASSAVANVTALGESVRFLLMHGVADDNVHFQNSLTLLDRLDLAGVENYDVHVFPDSDHGIYFHNANRIVYDKLTKWLVNAFNGEWLKIDNPKPVGKHRRGGG